MVSWLVFAAVFALGDERQAIAADLVRTGKPGCTSYGADGVEAPCRPAIALVPGRSINAWRQGAQIRITRAASQRLNRDEFALLTAHEIAHYYLGHTDNSQANELAADRLGAELACRAGYDPAAGASVLRFLRAGPHHPRRAVRLQVVLGVDCQPQAGSVSAS
jgi:hypothetical protein